MKNAANILHKFVTAPKETIEIEMLESRWVAIDDDGALRYFVEGRTYTIDEARGSWLIAEHYAEESK